MAIKDKLYKGSLGGLALAIGLTAQPVTKPQELSDLVGTRSAYAQSDARAGVDYEALAQRVENIGAEKHYKEALIMLKPYENDSNNRSSNFFNGLGLAYRKNGEYEKAEKAYLKAIELDPLSFHERINLGILYLKYLKDIKKAEEQFRFVVENIDPNNDDANFLLRRIKEKYK